MTLERLDEEIAPQGLMLMGTLPHPDDETRTIALIGAHAGFWPVFTSAAEYADGLPDPIDRWSERVIGALAVEMKGSAAYPSDGPPYAPFIAWAEATGRFWPSPTGMLIHDSAGLMVSIRGALILPFRADPTRSGQSPCTTCITRPCVAACPVDALSDCHTYDVPACKAFLDTPAGLHSCMYKGCSVRTACPLSQAFNRPDAQSAFHMNAFKGA